MLLFDFAARLPLPKQVVATEPPSTEAITQKAATTTRKESTTASSMTTQSVIVTSQSTDVTTQWSVTPLPPSQTVLVVLLTAIPSILVIAAFTYMITIRVKRKRAKLKREAAEEAAAVAAAETNLLKPENETTTV